jgi:riboflavin synthase
MFTGIIETMGQVKEVLDQGTNKIYLIYSTLTPELKIDQSLAHDGVCLTVEDIQQSHYKVTAISETLQKTTLKGWKAGTFINLERSLLPTSRLDGHFVQGHIDTTATCQKIKDQKGSWEIAFSFPKKFATLLIEKGSISVNGISLTCYNVKRDVFSVAVIPYTFSHTNFQYLKEKEFVNLEFDLLGKYILRLKALKR